MSSFCVHLLLLLSTFNYIQAEGFEWSRGDVGLGNLAARKDSPPNITPCFGSQKLGECVQKALAGQQKNFTESLMDCSDSQECRFRGGKKTGIHIRCNGDDSTNGEGRECFGQKYLIFHCMTARYLEKNLVGKAFAECLQVNQCGVFKDNLTRVSTLACAGEPDHDLMNTETGDSKSPAGKPPKGSTGKPKVKPVKPMKPTKPTKPAKRAPI